MIKFLLKQIEKSPNSLFSKKELLAISPSNCADLTKKNILSYINHSDGVIENIKSPRCPHGCTLSVKKQDGNLEAFCMIHPSEGMVSIDKNDLCRYSFNIRAFVELIRNDNNLAGNYDKLDDRLYFIGVLNVRGKSTAIILALCSNPKTAGTLLLSIPSQIARYQAGIVLMPFFDKISQNTRRILEDRNIHYVNFADAFGDKNWVISQDILTKISQKEKIISFSKAKKSKINLTKSVFQYKDKQLIGLINQTHKILLRILDKGSGKTKNTYISLEDIVKACGWKMEDYKLEPENYKNRISGAISKINKVLVSAGLPEIGRLDSKKGYLCPIFLKDIEIVAPTSSGKARPNINRLKESLNTHPSTDE